MSDPKTITATEASRSFSELLHRVCYGGESFVIKKGNRIMAKIGPAEETRHSEEPKATRQSSPAPKQEKPESPQPQARPQGDEQKTVAAPPPPAASPDYYKDVAAAMNKMLAE